jgi:hydrogenase nickel incorporation protein HypA/HybF
MHELSIARSILEIVSAEMRKSGANELRSLKIRIGELTAVDSGALRFAFDSCTMNTPMRGARLDIEEVPLTGRCSECNKEFLIIDFKNRCPHCNGASIEKLTGTELDIISMEVF